MSYPQVKTTEIKGQLHSATISFCKPRKASKIENIDIPGISETRVFYDGDEVLGVQFSLVDSAHKSKVVVKKTHIGDKAQIVVDGKVIGEQG